MPLVEPVGGAFSGGSWWLCFPFLLGGVGESPSASHRLDWGRAYLRVRNKERTKKLVLRWSGTRGPWNDELGAAKRVDPWDRGAVL